MVTCALQRPYLFVSVVGSSDLPVALFYLCTLFSVQDVSLSKHRDIQRNTANTAEGGWSVLSRSGRLVRATAVGA